MKSFDFSDKFPIAQSQNFTSSADSIILMLTVETPKFHRVIKKTKCVLFLKV